MARSYANLATAIWRPGSPFRDLRADEQRAYMMLFTQSDISAAGVLALTAKRWSQLAADTTVEDVHRVLVSLADARCIVIDWDTEEVLLRSFVRDDNGWNNSKRRPAILEAARSTRSPLLRRALAAEFGRLGLPTAGLLGPEEPDPLAHRTPDRASDGPSPGPSAPDWPEITFPQVDSPSDAHPDRAPDGPGVVVTDLEGYGPNPQPATPTPVAAPPLASDPSTVTAEEEGARLLDEEHLVDQVLAIRSGWSARSITRVLRDPEVACRPWPVVAAAMLAVAQDPNTTAPGRLRGDGPWWSAAAGPPRSPTVVAPPCGECGPNRQVETADGRPARCPRCHPLRRQGAAA